MSRPKLLDLFCGGGGASVGYHRAGFDVTGVDDNPKVAKHYPFEFHHADALEYLADHGGEYDVIHASPPCQSESDLRHRWDVEYPDLLAPTLAALVGIGRPWIVENVDSTKQLPGALILCGAAFGLGATCKGGIWRPLKRHRRFGSNTWLMGPGCACPNTQPVGVYGNGGGGDMTRGYKATRPEARAAMGIDWMPHELLVQAIPPVYCEFVGAQLLAALEAAA